MVTFFNNSGVEFDSAPVTGFYQLYKADGQTLAHLILRESLNLENVELANRIARMRFSKSAFSPNILHFCEGEVWF